MRNAVGTIDRNPIGYIDTMLEYYLHIDPSGLNDQQWAEKLKQLADIRQKELKIG
ncbi:MAG: hypothetical protein IJL44_07410 [Bacteroidales bacterium]|nr:hypothetical protein [Bacteroidales bacterium]